MNDPSRTTPSPLRSVPVFYTPRMVANAHSFSPSAGKPASVVESWTKLGVPLEFRSFDPATRDQLCLAHLPAYVDGILAGREENGFGNRLPEVAAALPYTSGAMIAAARAAIESGVAVAPASGFHHACYEQGGGYCTFNGLIVAAQVVHREGAARVGILDFDEHYGNGTTDIIKQLGLNWIEHYSAAADWEAPAQASAFLAAIPQIMRRFGGCGVLLYQAGADPHVNDPLGGWLTTEQLRLRDRLVFQHCRAMNLPVAWNLAGGYQNPLRKVLDIHDNTMRMCALAYCAPVGEPDAMRQLRNGKKSTSEADTAAEMPASVEVSELQPFEEPKPDYRRALRRIHNLPEEPLEAEPDPWRELPPLTPELRKVILDLAMQSDIHSLSCPFRDYDLWHALIEEQVKRSRATGLPYQEAFCLCAPDTGIDGMQRWDDENECSPFVPPPPGGHISYEGVCGGDLFIVPAWRRVWPGDDAKPEEAWRLVGKKCNYILSHRDLGIVNCATRTIVAGCWYLYKSNAPYEDCNPFRGD